MFPRSVYTRLTQPSPVSGRAQPATSFGAPVLSDNVIMTNTSLA